MIKLDHRDETILVVQLYIHEPSESIQGMEK